MPTVDSNGARIYWEAEGAGAPLLFIPGLGVSLDLWKRLAHILSDRYRTILFDNQGVGRSSDEPFPYSIEGMADAAAAVIDAAGERAVHVMGNSMGGMIAQELTLRHPDRVRSLILGCTTCGGRDEVLATREVLALLKPDPQVTGEQAFWRTAPILYAADTPRERVAADIALRVCIRRTVEGYMGQLNAIRAWKGTLGRLSQIAVPTLVMHGDLDQLIPAENGRILASAISGARLVILDGAAHMMFADGFDRAREAVVTFLAEQMMGRRQLSMHSEDRNGST